MLLFYGRTHESLHGCGWDEVVGVGVVEWWGWTSAAAVCGGRGVVHGGLLLWKGQKRTGQDSRGDRTSAKEWVGVLAGVMAGVFTQESYK